MKWKFLIVIFSLLIVLIFGTMLSACQFGIVNTVPIPTASGEPTASENQTKSGFTQRDRPWQLQRSKATPSPTPTSTPTPTPTLTPTPTATPTPTPTPVPTPQVNPSQEITLVSYNIDGINDISERKENLLNVLLSQNADSIGLQEVMGEWNDYLKEGLKAAGYGRFGVDAGAHEESKYGYFATYIFYNENKYDVINGDTFWMTETPEVSSKYGPMVTCFRTCTWVMLKDKVTGFTYVHMNLHLDWEDENVTIAQVQMIKKLMLEFYKLGYPVFVTGDFNSKEDSNPYREMILDDRIVDSKKVALETDITFTYNNYGRIVDRYTLDYCFTIGEASTISKYKVLNDVPNGIYLSDHFGISVTATIKQCELLEKYKQEPITKEGMVSFTLDTESSGTIQFDACRDITGNLAKYYIVSIYNENDVLYYEKRISGEFYCRNSKETFSVSLKNIVPGEMTIFVTPVSFLGISGKSYSFAVTIPDYEHLDLGDGDVVAIHIDENDIPRDFSGNNLTLEKIGEVSIMYSSIGKLMYFNGIGNYKISGFKNMYSLIEDGFSLEVLFKTCSDVTRKQAIVSNFHSGGLGFEIENGKLMFSVWISGGYKRVSVDVEANKEYHVVGIYSTSKLFLYVNGKLAGETRISGIIGFPTVDSAKYLCIGADSNATGQGESQSTSYIKYVNMWSFPLVSDQVERLYENSKK